VNEPLHEQVNRSLRAAGVSTDARQKMSATTLKDRRNTSSSGGDGDAESDKLAGDASASNPTVIPDHFAEPEDGPDEVMLKHAEQERCTTEMKLRDRKVKLAMLGMLSAADSIASTQSRRRDRE